MSAIILNEPTAVQRKKQMSEVIQLKLPDGRFRKHYGKIDPQSNGDFLASILIDKSNDSGGYSPVAVDGFLVRTFKRIGSARRAILDYLASAV